MSITWLLMIGPVYVGIIMGYLHPDHWVFITASTAICCLLLGLFGRKFG